MCECVYLYSIYCTCACEWGGKDFDRIIEHSCVEGDTLHFDTSDLADRRQNCAAATQWLNLWTVHTIVSTQHGPGVRSYDRRICCQAHGAPNIVLTEVTHTNAHTDLQRGPTLKMTSCFTQTLVFCTFHLWTPVIEWNERIWTLAKHKLKCQTGARTDAEWVEGYNPYLTSIEEVIFRMKANVTSHKVLLSNVTLTTLTSEVSL